MKKMIGLGFVFFLILSCGSFSQKKEKFDRKNVGYTFELDGRKRNYIVRTPTNYDSRKKYPLVLAFHGARGNPEGLQGVSGFNQISEREGFILVYPFGTTADEKIGFFWNAWECCGYALQQEVNDIRFVKKLISILKQDFSVHSEKIYAVGFSNGGMLSLRLACEASEEFTAIASVGGAMFHENCQPNFPLPVFLIQGKQDRVVPIEGGVGQKSSTTSAKLPSFQTFQFWSRQNLCEREKSIEDQKTIIYESLDCKTGHKIKMAVVKEEEHSWPIDNYPASEEIWKFLKQWTRPKNKYPT